MTSEVARTRAAYPFATIERAWQAAWESADAFRTTRTPGRPKWFVIELPPFANGVLHLGHVRNYTMADVSARFRRMTGHDVLYTTGFDSFGLPTELAARDEEAHPLEVAERAIARITEQLVRLGLSHDRRRITAYHEAAYYRWMQWVFLRLFKAGWAYRREAAVNWCRSCQTSLADSLVEGGRCWRCGTPVTQRALFQWFVDEARFADALLDGLPALSGWPDLIKNIHVDWIGRRRGYEVPFALAGGEGEIDVFVDHPALLLGIEFLALRRDHPVLVALLASATHGRAVAERLTELETQEAVRLGLEVNHPLGGVPLPLIVFGHGSVGFADAAVIGVPAHRRWDQRIGRLVGREGRAVLRAPQPDHGFTPFDWKDDWVVMASGSCAGLTIAAADAEIARQLRAVPAVRYRLRDWSIARQRYWGPPVPVVHCPSCGEVGVPEAELPVRLPYDVDVQTPRNPLDGHAAFASTACPRCAGPARRDTDTLEAYSSPWWMHWICMSEGADSPFERADSVRWMPVDVMIGGIDQARTCFFHTRMMERALHALGIVDVVEPVRELVAIGMVKADGQKMSKSHGNTVDPMDLVSHYGVDALRLGVLAAAAPDTDVNWSEVHIRRAFAFLNRLWRFVTNERRGRAPDGAQVELDAGDPGAALRRRFALVIDSAVHSMTSQLEHHHYHLATLTVETLFKSLERFAGEVRRLGRGDDPRDMAALRCGIDALLGLLAPLCPHIAEELWGRQPMLAFGPWPTAARPESGDRAAFRRRREGPARAVAGGQNEG